MWAGEKDGPGEAVGGGGRGYKVSGVLSGQSPKNMGNRGTRFLKKVRKVRLRFHSYDLMHSI